MNTISFMSANYVARQLGYNMTGGWAQGDRATNDYFRPLDTFAERFDALLREVHALGFTAIDLWTAHLHWAWATDRHIAAARELLNKHGLTVASLAGGFGNTPEEVERACGLAVALGAPVLGGSTPLLERDQATLAALLSKHGVRFGLENHPERTAAELRAKIGDGGGGLIGVTVDTGIFGMLGYDAARAIDELAPHIVHVHLKDVRAAGAHETCRFGEGIVPIEGCVRALQRIGYAGAISVEHEPEHSDPGEVARQSAEILRGWLS